MNRAIKTFLWLICLAGTGNTAPAVAGDLIVNHASIHHLDHGQERLLVDALEKIRSDRVNEALPMLHRVTTANPKFRLAQLIYADMLLARSRPLKGFGGFPSARYDQILSLREEARARWSHYLAQPPENRIPGSLVELGPHQTHAVVVDASQSRLYLFENRGGIPRLVHDFYASLGKQGVMKFREGDQKTPIGVYFVTGFISPEELPDLYGDGAFPIDYPNAWDQRHGRTGYGIWLHGTPSDTYSRPPRDSDGCVIVSNRDLNKLATYLKSENLNTIPVVITQDIRWLTLKDWQGRQERFGNYVDQWRRDWESRNADLYLSHYSPKYSGLGKDYEGWVEYKRRVNSAKEFIDIEISDKSMFLYPGEEGLLVVTFEQEYKSNNIRRRFVKRQYWRLEEDGTWRIVYEGSVS